MVLLSFVVPLLAALVEVAPPGAGEAVDLIRVRNEARQLRQTLPAGERVEVVFAPGVYWVTNTVTLFKADSRTLWRAAKPGKTHFRGGVEIPKSAFRAGVRKGVDVCAADVSALVAGELTDWPDSFRVPPGPWLYRNGKPLEIARYPNGSEWLTFENSVVAAGEAAQDGAANPEKATAIVCNEARAKDWDFSAGIWFYGYWRHDWSESFIKGAAFDPVTKTLSFSGRHQYGLGGKTWGFKGRRYCVYNALSELDAPGEWYLDRAKKRLLVVPQADEEKAHYVLATSTVPFVKADGLTDFAFEGIVFEYSHANTAVQLDHVDGVRLTACDFVNLGGTALQLTGDNARVDKCRFGNLGKGAIILAGGNRKTLKKSNIVIDGCQFRRWARFLRTYTPGVLVQGCGQVVRNCVFRDAPHNAILFKGNDHLIESNEFDRVLMETGDAGAIYTGRNPSEMGTMIRGNYFHDLGDPTKRDYTSAVYFDDCDWGDSVISNRFERLGRGVLLGGGNLFRIEGNTFADCKIGIHIDSRGTTWRQWTEHPDWFTKAFAEFCPFNDAWRAAYPGLASALETDPFAPWNNVVEGNEFKNCEHKTQYDKGVTLGSPRGK